MLCIHVKRGAQTGVMLWVSIKAGKMYNACRGVRQFSKRGGSRTCEMSVAAVNQSFDACGVLLGSIATSDGRVEIA
eukprot:7174395-Ditylum_brightwellii.AAC.1